MSISGLPVSGECMAPVSQYMGLPRAMRLAASSGFSVRGSESLRLISL